MTGAAGLRPRSRAFAGRARVAAACLAFLPLWFAPNLSPGIPLHAAADDGRTQQAPLDAAAVAEAIRTGRSSPAELGRFHAGYTVAIDDPVLKSVEVVTPFRRVVQLTEEREAMREATWDVSKASAVARDFEGRLDLVLRLQFSPSNTYRGVPDYSLIIYLRNESGRLLLPLDTRSTASYLAGQPAPPGTPILAATVTSVFDEMQVERTSPLLAAILLDGREVRRVALDLRNMR